MRIGRTHYAVVSSLISKESKLFIVRNFGKKVKSGRLHYDVWCLCAVRAADPMSVESPDQGLADSGKDSPIQLTTDDTASPPHEPTLALVDTANTVVSLYSQLTGSYNHMFLRLLKSCINLFICALCWL